LRMNSKQGTLTSGAGNVHVSGGCSAGFQSDACCNYIKHREKQRFNGEKQRFRI